MAPEAPPPEAARSSRRKGAGDSAVLPARAENTDSGTKHSAERSAKRSTEQRHSTDSGAKCGAEHSTSGGADSGAEYGAEHSTERSTEHSTECGAECSTDNGIEHDTEYGAEYSTEHGTEHSTNGGAEGDAKHSTNGGAEGDAKHSADGGIPAEAAGRRDGRPQIRLWAVAAWLILWQAASAALAQPLLLPPPAAALRRFGELSATAAFWLAAGRSSARILGGFAAGCLSGVLLAAAAHCCRHLRELLEPAVAAVKAVPVASFVILSLIWLNARTLPVFISFLMALPPVYLGVLEGLGQADRKLLEMAQVFRVPLFRRIGGIYLPRALPSFRTAVSLAIGLCWKAGIAAEVIGLPSGSLGDQLYQAKVYFLTADLFAWTAAVVALSLLFERVLLRLLDLLAARAGCAPAASAERTRPPRLQ